MSVTVWVKARRLSVLGVTAVIGLLMSGCVRHGYCAKPQTYESAESVPVIGGTGTLVVKSSPNAFIIPPPPANPVPFGTRVDDPERPGNQMWSCLDQPPAFTPAVPTNKVQ
jgi:hypothetical protein